jgi:hypothetical protein
MGECELYFAGRGDSVDFLVELLGKLVKFGNVTVLCLEIRENLASMFLADRL